MLGKLDLIRRNALPSHQMMTAAKGALNVPAEEMVEILVYLADNNKIFGEQARVTLAGWDEKSAKAIASNPATPKEVLDYWVSAKNLRPTLFPLLLENPSVSANKLCELAATSKGQLIDTMLESPRVRSARPILNELSGNKELSGLQNSRVQEIITGKKIVVAEPEPATSASLATAQHKREPVDQSPVQPSSQENKPAGNSPEPDTASDPETETAVTAYLKEHEAEIVAEGDKPFQPLGGIHEEIPAEPQVAAAAAGASASAAKPSATPAKIAPKKTPNPQDEQRGSVLQKIAKLDIKGRIQLAMKGTKEERSILVRDGTKLVALAVLDSPKITDGEVEKFASQKNVLEAVLRAIPMKRRFAKNYAVVRNLVCNPRTPLDVALGLMKNLLVQDLKNLSGNKEVSETIRKLALRMFKQKMETASKN
ncbi:MAG TPA: hypothetical protein VFA85_08835 [Terriglobales bacterium]|nr:hypothetical protein [Terriglobales bacterium]